jgi:hypothetical protein
MTAELQDAVSLADELLENEISRVAALVPMGITPSERREICAHLEQLCMRRSAEQVERIRRARGMLSC